MKYAEIVEKLKAHEDVSSKEVNGAQLFMLFQDRYLKYIVKNGCTFEINIVPVEDNHIGIDLTRERYPEYKDMLKVFEDAITASRTGHNCYVHFDGFTFQIIIEVMETDE